MKNWIPAAILTATLAAFALSSPAQEEPGAFAYRADRFTINVGGQLFKLNTDSKLNVDNLGGTNIDLEDDFGLDNNPTTWRLDAGWRFFNKHQLVFTYYEYDRHAHKTSARDFTYDGVHYSLGSQFNTSMDQTHYQLKYNWYFLQKSRGEFGMQIGLSYSDIQAELELAADGWAGGNHALVGVTRSNDMKAPTVTIGVAGAYQFTPNCFFRGEAGWLQLNVNGYKGRVTTLRATVDYYPWKYCGFGGGYELNNIKITTDKSDWDGYFRTTSSSFVGYLTFKF